MPDTVGMNILTVCFSLWLFTLYLKSAEQCRPHLSEHPSDLIQNGTQEKKPISSTVFNTFSHGVPRFVASGSSIYYLLTGWNSSNQQPINSFYSMVFEATTRNKTGHTMWKGMENCARKWCPFLCSILVEVICGAGKMWGARWFKKF